MQGYGKRLANLRGDRSRTEVAAAVGISESAYAMYELETRVPRDEVKIKLAKYFGESVQNIFFANA